MKKALLKNSDQTKEFNICSSRLSFNQILEGIICNQTVKTDRHYQNGNLIEMIIQIKFNCTSAESDR